MESSLFAFAVDLADEGTESLLDATRAAGVGGISLAAAYHHARDLLPHNPRRKVHYHEGGTVFFEPEGDYGTLRPRAARLVADGDPLAGLCEAATARDMQVRAWTVYLHNSRLATTHPDCAPQNAFGDRYLTDLCPAHPEVRRYAIALTADICRYPITSIMAEALHFKPLEHGYHHERYFVNFGPLARFLLGLCFCAWCRAAAAGRGVDGDAVAAAVRGVLRPWFEAGTGGHEPAVRDAMSAAVGSDVDGYLDARLATVTSLVAEVHAAAGAAGVALTFSAHGGSAKGGDTRSGDSAGDAWMLGVDLNAVSTAADEFEMLGYSAQPEDIEATFRGYRNALAPETRVAAALRPMWPDTSSAADLATKVGLARGAGAHRVDFYHYGLMPLASLDWIATALGA